MFLELPHVLVRPLITSVHPGTHLRAMATDATVGIASFHKEQLTSAFFRKLAPAVRLDTIQPSEPDDADSDDLKKQQVVRLADGGYVDNTAVAFIIKHLQDNGLGEDFRIVLFMNTTSKSVQMGSHKIPGDIARLFGGSKLSSESDLANSNLDKFPVTESFSFDTISAHIFEKAAWDNVTEQWATPEDPFRLRHFALQVETVNNLAFGIKAGDKGELLIFISEHTEASIVPMGDDDFLKYKDIYTKTRGMMKERQERIDSLRAAMGIIAPEGSVKVRVALSGGGWHSHTCHSAWFAAMLDAPWAPTLKQVLHNVDVIASNSGGSWFLSMLAFSKAFRESLEVKTSRDQWAMLKPDADANGFLEQTRMAFGNSFVEGWLPEDKLPVYRILRLALWHLGVWFDWEKVVKSLVYRPYDMKTELENVSLSGTCQDWVNGPTCKTLLFATALMTEKVVLCHHGWNKDEQMYDVEVEGQKMFTPVVFARTAPDHIPPHLLTIGKEAALAYTSRSTWSEEPKGKVVVNQEDKRDGIRSAAARIKVMDAAAASSAAAACVASTEMSEAFFKGEITGSKDGEAFMAAIMAAEMRVESESPDAKRQKI